MLAELIEKTLTNVFTELDNVGRDYMYQIQSNRITKLSETLLTALDMLAPENVLVYGKTTTILNLRLILSMATDESLTDNQELPP